MRNHILSANMYLLVDKWISKELSLIRVNLKNDKKTYQCSKKYSKCPVSMDDVKTPLLLLLGVPYQILKDARKISHSTACSEADHHLDYWQKRFY